MVENMRGWLRADGLVMVKYTSQNHARLCLPCGSGHRGGPWPDGDGALRHSRRPVAVVADPFGNTLVLLDLSKGHYVTDSMRNVGLPPVADGLILPPLPDR